MEGIDDIEANRMKFQLNNFRNQTKETPSTISTS